MHLIKKIKLCDNQYLYHLKILEDNYTYIVSWKDSALVIDPGESSSILELLKQEKLKLSHILITHYHDDHTGGVDALVKKTQAHVIGPEDSRIPHLEQTVDDSEEVICGPYEVKVLATPGHTVPHNAYFFQDFRLLFTGDVLFSGGCGRLFEGTPKEMWDSLNKINQLPSDTVIYCGHEYTVSNLTFALSLEPDNEEIKNQLKIAKDNIAAGKSTIPSSLDLERRINPFLRVNDREFVQALGKNYLDQAGVFGYLRDLKDRF